MTGAQPGLELRDLSLYNHYQTTELSDIPV